METEQKDAAPQEVEEVIKKKRTRKTNVNFSAQTAGMKTEQLTVCCCFTLFGMTLQTVKCLLHTVHAASWLPCSSNAGKALLICVA